MNVIAILGTALGAAWTSGINLYATVAVLGLLQHYKFARLPGGLEVLDNWWIIGVALGLYVVEFVADKVPYVDSVWDVVHTFVRVPAGAALALAATTDLAPAVQVVALLLGGTLALSTHGTKATVRAADYAHYIPARPPFDKPFRRPVKVFGRASQPRAAAWRRAKKFSRR